jgi:hypothetical protein
MHVHLFIEERYNFVRNCKFTIMIYKLHMGNIVLQRKSFGPPPFLLCAQVIKADPNRETKLWEVNSPNASCYSGCVAMQNGSASNGDAYGLASGKKTKCI